MRTQVHPTCNMATIAIMNDHKKNTKKPWPTKEAMAQIYEKNLWGGGDTDFYSGAGSHHPELVTPYVEKLRSFLRSFEEVPVVCDLGCGDFNIGRQLVEHTKKYKAVDIVPDLIERNKETFMHPKLEFQYLDLAQDEFPSGDCAILRNVLQHLSNAEIRQIVPKLYNFDYVVVTEHLPEGAFTPNKDIISGQGIRLKKGSGVDLLAPPFNFEVGEQEEWLSLPDPDWGGVLVTSLYKV
nr:class I SAM-dependent methyltransferase [Gracilimonas tropica]